MCVERRRARLREKAYTAAIERDHNRTRDLLYAVLPGPIADRMLAGEVNISDEFADATVVFADICGFTAMCSQVTACELVKFLNALFSAFDQLGKKHHIGRVKTIGDCYMAVAGVPIPQRDHVTAAALMAIAMRDESEKWLMPNGEPLKLRIGLNSGPVVAGVVGSATPFYDLWGDVVNVASRMESSAQPGTIQISSAVRGRLSRRFRVEARGDYEIRGKGTMQLYTLLDHCGAAGSLDQN